MSNELSEEEMASILKYAKQYLAQKLTNMSNLEWLKENEKQIAEEIRIIEEARARVNGSAGVKEKSHP